MKLCVIYNAAQRYRESVFRELDSSYDCDWYFGPIRNGIKEMDTSLLRNVKFYKSTSIFNRLYWKHGILRLLMDKKYDKFLFFAESRSITDYLFMLIGHLFYPNKEIYIWTHGLYGKERFIELKLKCWLYKYAKAVFVYGNYSKKIMEKNGLSKKNIFVIYNSLHYDKQLELRKSIKLSGVYDSHFLNGKPTIIFIGRLTKVKRLDLLLKALVKLKEKNEVYNLVLIGDGEERTSLKKEVELCDLTNNVWFYGECYDEVKNAELIYNADLCVAPGNVGLTAMHSMMFGCPVISHDDFKWQMPEFEAIKPGLTGDFFNRCSVDSLASTISRWFSLHVKDRQAVRLECFKEIDDFWNPKYQINLFKKVIK